MVIASRTRVCRRRNYIPLLVGLDSGKMAGLGQPDSFIASSTCKSTGCTSILTQQRTDRGLYRPRFASVQWQFCHKIFSLNPVEITAGQRKVKQPWFLHALGKHHSIRPNVGLDHSSTLSPEIKASFSRIRSHTSLVKRRPHPERPKSTSGFTFLTWEKGSRVHRRDFVT